MSTKETINRLANEYAAARRVERDSTSSDVMETYIVNYGWKPYDYNKDYRLWTKDGIDCGVTLANAYEIEKRTQWKEERKKARKDSLHKPPEEREVIPCNKCGADVSKQDGEDLHGYYGLIDAQVHGGYNSDSLQDGLIYTFSLCEKCLMELFEQFKDPPHIQVYI